MPQPSLLFDGNGNPVQYRHADGDVLDLDAAALARQGILLPNQAVGTQKVREATVSFRSTREDVKDSYDPSSGSVLIGIDASHAGYWNKNLRYYTVKGMKRYIDTWLMFEGAPFIRDHDDSTSENRLGTVREAAYRSTGKETGYEDLTVEITDKDEIEKVVSGKSIAVSVGGKPADAVECSCCGHDLYGQGFRPRQIYFDKKPADSWLHAGAFGGRLTNEDFWEIEENEDGKWVGRCWHLRGIDSPPDHDHDGTADKVGYFYHGVIKEEISKVLFGADRNDATGEWAHIRGLIDAADAIEDEEVRLQVVMAKLGKVGSGPVDRSRFSVVPSIQDLYVADSADDAIRVAKTLDPDQAFFDANLYNFACTLADNFDGRVRAYHGLGGRFVATATTAEDLDVARVLSLSAKDFGAWFRTEGRALDAAERDMIQRLHAHRTTRLLRSRHSAS